MRPSEIDTFFKKFLPSGIKDQLIRDARYHYIDFKEKTIGEIVENMQAVQRTRRFSIPLGFIAANVLAFGFVKVMDIISMKIFPGTPPMIDYWDMFFLGIIFLVIAYLKPSWILADIYFKCQNDGKDILNDWKTGKQFIKDVKTIIRCWKENQKVLNPHKKTLLLLPEWDVMCRASALPNTQEVREVLKRFSKI